MTTLRTDALIGLAAAAILLALALSGYMVTVQPDGQGVSVITSDPLPARSNTVAAATIGAAITAACAAFGLPIPPTAATGGVVLLISVWAWIRQRRANKKGGVK